MCDTLLSVECMSLRLATVNENPLTHPPRRVPPLPRGEGCCPILDSGRLPGGEGYRLILDSCLLPCGEGARPILALYPLPRGEGARPILALYPLPRGEGLEFLHLRLATKD